MRCGQCGVELPEHGYSCPSRYQVLASAESIAETREALMAWATSQAHLIEYGLDVGAVVAAAAKGISARAAQLGLERDEPGDREAFDTWRR